MMIWGMYRKIENNINFYLRFIAKIDDNIFKNCLKNAVFGQFLVIFGHF